MLLRRRGGQLVCVDGGASPRSVVPSHRHASARAAAGAPSPEVRREKPLPYYCPACGNRCYNGPRLLKHLQRCCPDLVEQERWAQVLSCSDRQAERSLLLELLEGIHHQERVLRELVLRRAFDVDHLPVSPGVQEGTQGVVSEERGLEFWQEAATRLSTTFQLPFTRMVKLLQMARREVPLEGEIVKDLQVVHEDEAFLVVNKPAGVRSTPRHRQLLTSSSGASMGPHAVAVVEPQGTKELTPGFHPDDVALGGGHPPEGSMVHRLVGYLGPGSSPHLLHRLDRDTSGVMVTAKSRTAARAAHAQIESHTVSKVYLAVCLESTRRDTFSCQAPIGRHPQMKLARAVDNVGGQRATTHFKVLQRVLVPTSLFHGEGGHHRGTVSRLEVVERLLGGSCEDQVSVVLVECCPETGRTHQIRVHLAHMGLLMLGDELYGVEVPHIRRQALHAYQMTLVHPTTGQPVTFTAPLAADIEHLLKMMGLFTSC